MLTELMTISKSSFNLIQNNLKSSLERLHLLRSKGCHDKQHYQLTRGNNARKTKMRLSGQVRKFL